MFGTSISGYKIFQQPHSTKWGLTKPPRKYFAKSFDIYQLSIVRFCLHKW